MVSIIIPCYNFGHLVGETIESLLNQTHSNMEIVVIDDGSTDNTSESVKKWVEKDARVSYHRFENTGLGASRNRGLAVIKGDYVQFLDADDLIENRKLEEQLKLFAANPDADIVYGSVRYFSKDPYDPKDRRFTTWGPNEEWMPCFTGRGIDLLDAALTITPAHLSSVLFKKSLIDKIGVFDNTISAVADYDFLLRCCIADAFFLYNDTPGTYSLVRWHPNNMSKNISLMLGQEIQLRKKIHHQLPTEQLKQKNEKAIKSHELRMKKSWKRIFLSGGPFDFLKKGLSFLRLDKLIKKLFYK